MDGTGYPDGIAGEAIPIGARILSVVDCYDALTSDRPCRPRLPGEEALGILIERRGTMYDPAVGDTFVRLHGTLTEAEPERPSHGDALARISSASAPGSAAAGTAGRTGPASAPGAADAATEDLLALCTLARSLSPAAPVHEAGLLLWTSSSGSCRARAPRSSSTTSRRMRSSWRMRQARCPPACTVCGWPPASASAAGSPPGAR